ncbi:hypothetical protein MWU60_04890 [Yoonia sp. F2084L]|uniref:hypothetical protein n=1 Tax=Yoonia sp. F2084L TaxID=2926419 RepID=UPI001FF1A3EF|nr:hypothetical protein [Yoonia sp. F2084L]MCK0094895.1 hypothetical protein [Yoonia sp. F2084L]
MEWFLEAFTKLLFLNAFISFFYAFYYQIKVGHALNKEVAHLSGMDKYNVSYSNFSLFLSGQVLPDLCRKWLRAVKWVVVSYFLLFAFAGVAALFD